MTSVSSIGHLTLHTPDLERQADHYKEIVGLGEIARDKSGIFLACPNDTCSVVLRQGNTAESGRLALRMLADTDLPDVVRRLEAEGLAPEMASDTAPGADRIVSVKGPEDLQIDLILEHPRSGVESGRGIIPQKLGHVAYVMKDVDRARQFFEVALGFRVSDWMGDFFVFMRCGPDHHTVNFIHGEKTRMHHHAFEARDFNHIKDTCDLLGANRIPLIWGPGRHGIGHNIFTYHYNPDEQIVEIYTELDQMSDESKGCFDPRPWHEDNPQRPKVWEPGPFTSNIWGIPTPPAIRK